MDRCGFPTKPVSAAMVQRGAGNALYPLGRCQEAAAALKELPKPGPFTWAASTQNGWIRARTSHCAEVHLPDIAVDVRQCHAIYGPYDRHGLKMIFGDDR